MRLISVSTDRSVPMDFKVSFPQGCFRNISRFIFKEMRPSFVDRQLHAPSWWKSKEVIAVFDKVMTDRVSQSRFYSNAVQETWLMGSTKSLLSSSG